MGSHELVSHHTKRPKRNGAICNLQSANCKLQTANCKLQTAGCWLQTALTSFPVIYSICRLQRQPDLIYRASGPILHNRHRGNQRKHCSEEDSHYYCELRNLVHTIDVHYANKNQKNPGQSQLGQQPLQAIGKHEESQEEG
eukprot:scaffold1857_cov247-Pinguiococcus_pyrenoidosus.AAC.2